MSILKTEAGKAMIELVSHWGIRNNSKEYHLKVLAPSYIKDFSQATFEERNLLGVIKANLSPEQWNNLPKFLNEALEYLPKAKYIKRQFEEQQKRERLLDELRCNSVRKEEGHQNLKKVLVFQQVENEERIEKLTLFEVERKKSIEILSNLFENDYLKSKQNWLIKLTDQVSKEEFNDLSARFVVNWFEKQGWQKPDMEQALCIAEVWDNVQVIARAGSGKTATIVNRATFLVKHCRVTPSEILLLAFNHEAAKEVNDRLHELLGENAPQAMTFHALAYALVHPEEALIYDDEINGFSKSSTVQYVIDSFLRDKSWSDKIKELMLRYFRADWDGVVSGGYHLEPVEMVKYRRSLSYLGLDGRNYKSKGEKRIADYLFEHDVPYTYEKNFWWDGLNYKPDFSIPAKDKNLKGIVIEYFGVVGDTEYNEQTRMKRSFWKNKSDYVYIELLPGQADSMEVLDQAVGIYLKSCGYIMRMPNDQEIWHRIKSRAVGEFSSMISQFISRCRKKMVAPEDLIDLVKKQSESLSKLQVDFLGVVWKIYQEYLRILIINEEEDFDGLLIRAEKVVKTGQSRWQRKAGSGDLRRVKYLFIDEYQDFSLLFFKLVSAINDISQSMKLFCVGDNWQAINGFAGSDLCFFNNFKDYFSDSILLKISTNYRSYQNIINIGNKLMFGEGPASKGVFPQLGEVWVAKIDEFIPNEFEEGNYKGDCITPALVRLVYSYIIKGQHVALLCRRRNGLTWYTQYEPGKGKYHAQFISAIRKALPEELRSMVVSMDTVHSYKGKEEDAIIVVDAISRSYPLIHPSNIFFEVLGQSIDVLISEEKRLFYVALSRAKKSLVIVTETENESPFLNRLNLKNININRLQSPKREGTHYVVSIYDNLHRSNGTYEIKSYLLENKYLWNPAKKAWIKHISAQDFSKEKLLDESWANNAANVAISVSDEFNNHILQFDIKDRK